MKLTLKNGLNVVLEENHAAPVVAFQAWVTVGSADEDPEVAGIAHMFEHMLFKGTAKRGVGQIAREVESAGGDINAWTSFDETVYHIVMASRFFDTGLDILADALMNSSFDPAELERERKVVLEEIKQGMDNPERVASELLFSSAYRTHPYRRPVIGSEASVRRMTRDDLVRFFQRYYVARNVTFVVVGDFNRDDAARKIEAAFGGMREGERPVARRPEPVQSEPRTGVLAQDVKEMHLFFAVPTPDIHHEDIPALDLLAVVLGQGESSRLNLEVVRNRQLVTSAFAYMFTPRDRGLMVFGATLQPGRADEAARAILDEAFRLAREEIGPEELAKARTILESDLVYDKETVQGYARKLGFFAAIAGDLAYEDRYFERLRRVTPADLREVAARTFKTAQLTTAALVPEVREAKRAARVEQTSARLKAVVGAAEKRADKRFSRARSTAQTDDVTRYVLPSGARLLVMRDTTVPIVAVRGVWTGGLRYEDARSNGVSNMLAALISRGTRTRTAEQIMSEVEGMAGALSGYAGRNSFGVRAEFLSRHWERGLELFADCIRNPRFSEDELERERRLVLDEIRSQEDNLGQVAFRLFHSTMWKKHPYRLDILGSAESVSALTRRRLLDHYRRHYNLAGLTIAVVGDVDPERVLAKTQALFGDAPGEAGEVPSVVEEPARTEPLQAFQFLSRQQAHVVLGFPGTTFRDRDRFPLEVLSQILAGHGGRLFVELREKRALAYRVSAFSLEGLDPGYFAVYVACSPEHLDEAVREIRVELARVLKDGISAEELERARNVLIGTHAISLQRKSALAGAIATHEAYGQSWREYRLYAEGIAKVTAADIQRAARKYLDARREVIAVVKPGDENGSKRGRLSERNTGAVRRAAAPRAAFRDPLWPSREEPWR